MNLTPADSTAKRLDFFNKSNEHVREWLKEDSTTKDIVVKALYLAGPKGMAVAKGIEVASAAASLLDKDRSQVTQGFQQSDGDDDTTRLNDAASFIQNQLKAKRMAHPGMLKPT